MRMSRLSLMHPVEVVSLAWEKLCVLFTDKFSREIGVAKTGWLRLVR